MNTNYAVADHVSKRFKVSNEDAIHIVESVVGYLFKHIQDESVQEQILTQIVKPSDDNRAHQFLAAILPPFSASDSRLIAALLDDGLDVNFRYEENLTALHFAVSSNRAEIVELLLVRGADTKAVADDMLAPLSRLADVPQPNPSIASLLLTAGSYPCIEAACAVGDPNHLARALEVEPDAIYYRFGETQETALHIAVRNGNFNLVRQLVQAGSDIEAMTHSGQTPLHYASATGQTDVAITLLNQGANPNSQSVLGATPMDFAIDTSGLFTNIVEILEQHGGYRRLERRIVAWQSFFLTLQRYYQTKCKAQVEIEFSEKGDFITAYNIWPNGQAYCTPRVDFSRHAGIQDDALTEIKHVLFKDEPVRVRRVVRRQHEGDLVLYVERLTRN